MPFFAQPAAGGRKSLRLRQRQRHSPQTAARIAAYRNLSNRLRSHGRILRRPSPDLDASASPTGPSPTGPTPTSTFALAGTSATTSSNHLELQVEAASRSSTPEFRQLVQQIERIQRIQRRVLGQEEGGEEHGAPAVTTAASTSSTAPVLEEDRVPVYRITRRPYVPYEPERRYMEDPSLPQAASRFRSMLGLPTRQGPEEDTTDPGEDGARSALPSTELEALRSELATIFGGGDHQGRMSRQQQERIARQHQAAQALLATPRTIGSRSPPPAAQWRSGPPTLPADDVGSPRPPSSGDTTVILSPSSQQGSPTSPPASPTSAPGSPSGRSSLSWIVRTSDEDSEEETFDSDGFLSPSIVDTDTSSGEMEMDRQVPTASTTIVLRQVTENLDMMTRRLVRRIRFNRHIARAQREKVIQTLRSPIADFSDYLEFQSVQAKSLAEDRRQAQSQTLSEANNSPAIPAPPAKFALKCTICTADVVDLHVTIPCGHAACLKCYQQMHVPEDLQDPDEKPTCYLCRGRITQLLKVFPGDVGPTD